MDTKKNKRWFIAILLTLTAVSFFPSLENGFVIWDDDRYVVDNETIKNISADNIGKMFTTSIEGGYVPLTLLTHALEYRLFGLNPIGYHLNNLLLHLLITLLAFFLFSQVSGDRRIAFIVAIFFGVHPIHVESVAWVTERKDVLCAFFYMLTLLAYLRYVKSEAKEWYFASFFLALLALFSKPMAVTLPGVMILFDLANQRRLIPAAVEKLPFLLLSFIFGVINIWFQGTEASLLEWVYFAFKAIPFYLSKLLIPANLSVMYSPHPLGPEYLPEMIFSIAFAGLLFLAAFFYSRKSRKILVGSWFFLLTVLPVAAVVGVGNPKAHIFAADRYMYIPSLGFFYLLAVFLIRAYDSRWLRDRRAKAAFLSFLGIWIGSLSWMTWNRCQIWKDTATLFAEELTDPTNKSPAPHNNVGVFYLNSGRPEEAISYFEESMKRDPTWDLPRQNCSMAYNNIGYRYAQEGDYSSAAPYYKRALSLLPENEKANNNLKELLRLTDAPR